MKTDIVQRSFDFSDFSLEKREVGKQYRRVEGHAAVFNSPTDLGYYTEVIERGAFDGCDFDDVLFFVNHDTRKIPLARSRRNNGNSSMELRVDDKGLYMRTDLDVENNLEARQLCSSLERGDITGMSFMFRVKEQKWEDLDSEHPIRRITKVSRVFEVSAVNTPAYEETDINARDREALCSARRALDNARSKELDSSTALEIEKIRLRILEDM